jgi:ankyrin repeat protein
LLRAGAPVNCRVTEDSSTPLHKACAGSKPGHLTAVKLLLENGADVHALNKWRETPLLTAANHGQAGAVDSLLKAGADPCKCTDTGWSPLSIAAYKGHDDVVRLLLEEGAPTEEADPTLSALLQAATKGLPGTVELLLKHGADHTVTTKKGDTALSILVEQNLIDAAVEMVTEYKASVPRCSRDRKKVQRARLLINLRVKQQQREGKHISLMDDDVEDESDQEDNVESTTTAAQHDEATQSTSMATKKKNKKKNKKTNAEQQAKQAEEALLLELEQEDAERHKQEAEASKKSAKKRKKKERERLQKKEQEERRLEEEHEKEEKLRKEREAKEAEERAERERLTAIKRKEEEEGRKRQLHLDKQKREQQQQREQEQRKKELQKKKQQEKASAAANSSPASRGKQANIKGGKRQPAQPAAPAPAAPANPPAGATTMRGMVPQSVAPAKPIAPAVSKQVGSAAARAAGTNRGWETKPVANNLPEPKQTPPKPVGGGLAQQAQPVSTQTSSSSSASSHFLTPQRENKPNDFFSSATQPAASPFASVGGELSSMLNAAPSTPLSYSQSDSVLNGLSSSSHYSVSKLELPAVSLFRRDKVSELLQRCAMARSSSDTLGFVSELTIKKVLYRWMVRAAHDSSACLDCIIPSWMDFEQLTTFFQRQFISESRKGVNPSAPGAAMMSMESLKEAGSAMAILCHSLAKDVADFRRRVEEQFPPDWTDRTIGMNASDMMRNGGGSAMVLVDWANRSQVYLPASTFTKLRERFVGAPSRLLSSIFTVKVRYDTKQLLVADTAMDYRLPPDTQSTLSVKASVSAEVWSDPLSTLSSNVFWGQFPDIDSLFGGLQPFSKEDGGEDLLSRHGGSVSVVPPLDNMVASRYVHRMLDLLETADKDRVPVSFAVFLRAECFLDWNNSPTVNDLHMLDPRLRDRSAYLARAEQLVARQHSFFSENSGSLETSMTGSLFVLLQNEAGRTRFDIRDAGIAEIIRSMGGNAQLPQEPQLITPMSFATTDFAPTQESSGGYFDSRPATVSPVPHQTIASDFGAIGGTTISNAFSNVPAPSGARRARGRLFDLVDDGEDDNSADVVSGMLGNLNMDLFQQPNSNDIDIEAISLMGIGGPPPAAGGLQPRHGRFG